MSSLTSVIAMCRAVPVALPVIAALLGACGETRTLMLPAAPADLFDTAMPVGIVSNDLVGERHGHVVAGARDGAGLGLAGGVLGSLQAGFALGPDGLVAGVLLAPVFGVGGAIYGASAAHPEEETKAAVAAIEQVYHDGALLAGLADMLGERLAAHGFPANLPCPDAPPRPASARTGRGTASLPTGCKPGQAKNLLRLDVTYSFMTIGAFSPDLVLGVDVGAVAMDAGRERAEADFQWTYRSAKLDFFNATAADAVNLRREIGLAQQRLADRILDDLVLTRAPARITGTYDPSAVRTNNPDMIGAKFSFARSEPGTVQRVPPESLSPDPFAARPWWRARRETAFRDYNRMAWPHPESVSGVNSRGLGYYDMGLYDRAIQDSGQAGKLNPNLRPPAQ